MPLPLIFKGGIVLSFFLIGLILIAAIDSEEIDDEFCNTTGQILKRNSTAWACADDATGGSANDTNETTRVTNMIGNCAAGQYIEGFNTTSGAKNCSTPPGGTDTNCNSSGSCSGGDVAYMNYANTGVFNASSTIYTSAGYYAEDQSTFIGGNGKIVTTNSGGAASFSGSSGGAIDFAGNTASIGISGDGTSAGYDYDGVFILKQKASNPDEVGEFIFIEEAGDWRFAIPSSGANLGTYNPRSMIIAWPSNNTANMFECAYWGFNNIDCNTSTTGADLGVQDDLEVLGNIFASNWSNASITESQISDLQSYLTNITETDPEYSTALPQLHNISNQTTIQESVALTQGKTYCYATAIDTNPCISYDGTNFLIETGFINITINSTAYNATSNTRSFFIIE